jgi:hypothetical protein
MKIHRIRTFDEWKFYNDNIAEEYGTWVEIEKSFAKKLTFSARGSSGKKKISVPGFSYTAQASVDFCLDTLYGTPEVPNWRERLVCPLTHLNNRIRASVHIMDCECGPYLNSDIYITEQVTPLYKFLSAIYPNLVGSEFLGSKFPGGFTGENGIRNEDLTSLSFETGSFDFCLSFDCLEHIPFFDKAFSEIYRVLKPGGKLLWSAPFDLNRKENVIRAQIKEDGSLEHILAPEYHGNPISTGGEGSLCFTIFGWEVLETIRQIGYSDSYAIIYWSDAFGYLGGHQSIFVAVK